MILVISFFVRCQLRCRRLIYISWPARRSFAQSRAMPGYAPRSELTKATLLHAPGRSKLRHRSDDVATCPQPSSRSSPVRAT
jgi:hypothetical protein